MSYPGEFHFTPYPQQVALIKAIVDCIVDSSCGCFESPTGTGKSLSVIYAALSWMGEEERVIIKSIETSASSQSSSSSASASTDLDWISAMQQQSQLSSKDDFTRLEQFRTMVHRVARARSGLSRSNMFMNKSSSVSTVASENLSRGTLTPPSLDDEFAPSDYDSDVKAPTNGRKRSIDDRIVVESDDDALKSSSSLSSAEICFLFFFVFC